MKQKKFTQRIYPVMAIFIMAVIWSLSLPAQTPLVAYTFEDRTFNSSGSNEHISVTPLANSKNPNTSVNNLSFNVFTDESDELLPKSIRDHGQGADHINAFTEQEALTAYLTGNKSDFLTFTVTPATAYTLKLDSLVFDLQARNGNVSGNAAGALTYYAGLYSSKTGFGFTTATENNRIGEAVAVTATGALSTSGWLHIKMDIDTIAFEQNEVVEFRLYIWRIGGADPRSERWMEFDNIQLYGLSDASGVSNFPPAITAIANQTVEYGHSSEALAFTVSDTESPANMLVVTAVSDSVEIISNNAITIVQPDAEGNGSVRLTPALGGHANITLKVTDPQGEFAVTTFKLTVTITVHAVGEGVNDDLFAGYVSGRTLPLPTPRLGYLFGGWYLNENFNGEPVTSVNTSCTLYAKWNPTITVIASGTAISSDFFAGYVPGETLPVPIRTGYHFEGWYTNADFTGQAVTSVTESCTLYAHWLQIVVTPFVSYTFDDGSMQPATSQYAGEIAATDIESHNTTFVIATDASDSHGENGGQWIRDHGQGPDHINAQTETDATNPNISNQMNDYLRLYLEPAPGDSIRLSKLSFDIQARTGDPSSPVELSYSASLYCSAKIPWTDPKNRIGNVVTVSSNEANSAGGWQTVEFDLNALHPAKDEIVEFRIYVWRQGTTNQRAERWVEFDNIILYGSYLQEPTSGIKTVEQSSQAFSIYPNPANNQINIGGLQGGETIRFFGMDGQLRTSRQATSQMETVSVSDWAKGVYLVRINNGTNAQTLKLIVNE